MSRRKRPRGAALVVALLTLMVVVLIAGAVLQSLLVQRRQKQIVENELQAALLADAAIERAISRLQRDPAYGGETWQVSLNAASEKPSAGHAEIQVTPASEFSSAQKIEVKAVYPVDSIRRVVIQRNYRRAKL